MAYMRIIHLVAPEGGPITSAHQCRSKFHTRQSWYHIETSTGTPAHAGLKAKRRAQFAAAVRVAADLDEDSLRLLLQFVPAWVKHSEYERAKCVLFRHRWLLRRTP